MKNTFKKIASAVASVVLGFSMITAPQVFAADGQKGAVVGTNSTCLAIVPSNGGSTSLQSMASDGDYIYVAKINISNEDTARIYRYNKNGGNCTLIRNKNGKDFGNFGHAGDMTAIKYGGKTYLLVLEKIDKYVLLDKIAAKKEKIDKTATIGKNIPKSSKTYTIVHILEVNNNTYTEVSKNQVELEIGSITADFREANSSNRPTLYLKSGNDLYKGSIDMKSKNINISEKTKLNFDGFDFGDCTTPQGMCHYRSNSVNCLFLSYSFKKGSSNKKQNIIINYGLNENKVIESYKIDATYKGQAADIVAKYKSDIPFELEDCVLIGTTLYYAVDCQKEGYNFDAIYRSKY